MLSCTQSAWLNKTFCFIEQSIFRASPYNNTSLFALCSLSAKKNQHTVKMEMLRAIFFKVIKLQFSWIFFDKQIVSFASTADRQLTSMSEQKMRPNIFLILHKKVIKIFLILNNEDLNSGQGSTLSCPLIKFRPKLVLSSIWIAD